MHPRDATPHDGAVRACKRRHAAAASAEVAAAGVIGLDGWAVRPIVGSNWVRWSSGFQTGRTLAVREFGIPFTRRVPQTGVLTVSAASRRGWGAIRLARQSERRETGESLNC